MRSDMHPPAGDSHRRSSRKWTTTLLMALSLAGCQSVQVAQPLTQEQAGNDPSSQLAFWHSLAERPVTSNDEAFHGLLLFFDGQDPAENYDQRVELLRSRQLLPGNFDQPADHAVQRGILAVTIARRLKIPGGLIMSLFGPTPRYAVRELEYMSLYPASSPHQTFSGAEFLGIIGRIEDYQRLFPPPQAPEQPRGD